MNNECLGIFQGQKFATANGEEFTVVDIVPKKRFAIVENLYDGKGVMDLGIMLEAIQTGTLVNIDEDISGSAVNGRG